MTNLIPYIDAFNIDLKGFTTGYYRELKGDLETVKGSIELATKNRHVEVTTLIVPGENDREGDRRNVHLVSQDKSRDNTPS